MAEKTETNQTSYQFFEFNIWCSLLDWFIDTNEVNTQENGGENPSEPGSRSSSSSSASSCGFKETSDWTSLFRGLMGYFILARIGILLGGWTQDDLQLEEKLDLGLDPNDTIGNTLTTALFTIYIAVFLFESGIILKNRLMGSGENNASISIKKSFLKNYRFEYIFYALIWAPANIAVISLKATDILTFTPASVFVLGLIVELGVILLRHDVEQKKLAAEISQITIQLGNLENKTNTEAYILKQKLKNKNRESKNLRTNTEVAVVTQATLITGFSLKTASSIMTNFFELDFTGNIFASTLSTAGSLVLSAAFIGYNLAKIGLEIKNTWDSFSEANKLSELLNKNSQSLTAEEKDTLYTAFPALAVPNAEVEKIRVQLQEQKALALNQLLKALVYHTTLIGVYATALLSGPIGGLCAMAAVLALQFALKGLKIDKKVDDVFKKNVTPLLFSKPMGKQNKAHRSDRGPSLSPQKN